VKKTKKTTADLRQKDRLELETKFRKSYTKKGTGKRKRKEVHALTLKKTDPRSHGHTRSLTGEAESQEREEGTLGKAPGEKREVF